MKLNDLLEARFAKQTYPDDKFVRLMKVPIHGNYYADHEITTRLMHYFMNNENDRRWRLEALKRYDEVVGEVQDHYDDKTLQDAVDELSDEFEVN